MPVVQRENLVDRISNKKTCPTRRDNKRPSAISETKREETHNGLANGFFLICGNNQRAPAPANYLSTGTCPPSAMRTLPERFRLEKWLLIRLKVIDREKRTGHLRRNTGKETTYVERMRSGKKNLLARTSAVKRLATTAHAQTGRYVTHRPCACVCHGLVLRLCYRGPDVVVPCSRYPFRDTRFLHARFLLLRGP